MTTTTESRADEVAAYLEEVSSRLAGLPEPERTELLDDLAHHLAEVMAEPGPPLAERVGPPAAYAAELLASAGVEASGPGPGLGRLIPTRLRSTSVRAVRALRSSRIGRELAFLEPALRPAWWVARAYLAVSLLAATSRGPNPPGFPGLPLPRLFDSAVLGLMAVLLAVPASVRLGRARPAGAPRWLMVGTNAVLVLYGVVLLAHGGTPRVHHVAIPDPAAQSDCLLDRAGQPITNLYAYGSDGALLDPVLLYDQAGRPIDHLCPQFDGAGRRLRTEYGRDVNGALVINAFPRRQWMEPRPDGWTPDGGFTPGAAQAVPVRPPAVVVPRLQPPATTAPTGQPAP